jgi:hypothetical protein
MCHLPEPPDVLFKHCDRESVWDATQLHPCHINILDQCPAINALKCSPVLWDAGILAPTHLNDLLAPRPRLLFPFVVVSGVGDDVIGTPCVKTINRDRELTERVARNCSVSALFLSRHSGI